MQSRCVVQSNTGLIVAGNDGVVHCHGADGNSTKLEQSSEWIEAMAVSPDGKFLAVASHDNYIRIYNCDGWLKCGDVRKHTSAVLMIDWSADSRKMRSNSLDWELLFWDVTEAGEISQDPSGRSNNVSTKWQTNTMKFGWHVEGIFPKNVVEADHINRVTGNLEESLLATADDFCNVRIFRNPARPGNVPRTYRGHGEHVTNVIFNGDKLFSTGGGDQTLIQWKKCE